MDEMHLHGHICLQAGLEDQDPLDHAERSDLPGRTDSPDPQVPEERLEPRVATGLPVPRVPGANREQLDPAGSQDLQDPRAPLDPVVNQARTALLDNG